MISSCYVGSISGWQQNPQWVRELRNVNNFVNLGNSLTVNLMENTSRTVRIQSEDLEKVVRTVRSYINVYETDVNPLSIRFFFFLSDNPDLTNEFDKLRTELVPEGYVPFLVKDVENFIEV